MGGRRGSGRLQTRERSPAGWADRGVCVSGGRYRRPPRRPTGGCGHRTAPWAGRAASGRRPAGTAAPTCDAPAAGFSASRRRSGRRRPRRPSRRGRAPRAPGSGRRSAGRGRPRGPRRRPARPRRRRPSASPVSMTADSGTVSTASRGAGSSRARYLAGCGLELGRAAAAAGPDLPALRPRPGSGRPSSRASGLVTGQVFCSRRSGSPTAARGAGRRGEPVAGTRGVSATRRPQRHRGEHARAGAGRRGSPGRSGPRRCGSPGSRRGSMNATLPGNISPGYASTVASTACPTRTRPIWSS